MGATLIIATWLAMEESIIGSLQSFCVVYVVSIRDTRITQLSTISHFYNKFGCKLLFAIAIIKVGNNSEPKCTLC
jgi:hypothetical protein